MKTRVTARTIGEYVHKKAMALMEEGQGDYWLCFRQTLDADDELKALYTGITKVTHGPEIRPAPEVSQSAGAVLDRLTRQFMHETNTTDYAWALRQIMKSNPTLFKRYTQS